MKITPIRKQALIWLGFDGNEKDECYGLEGYIDDLGEWEAKEMLKDLILGKDKGELYK